MTDVKDLSATRFVRGVGRRGSPPPSIWPALATVF